MYQRIGFRGVGVCGFGAGPNEPCSADSDCGENGYCCPYPDGVTKACVVGPSRAQSIAQCMALQAQASACPSGTSWNPEHGQCEGYGTVVQKTCPSGTTWNVEHQQCEGTGTRVPETGGGGGGGGTVVPGGGGTTPPAAKTEEQKKIFGMSPVVAASVGIAGGLVALKLFGVFG